MKNIVYKIENVINHKSYVGSAVNFLARKSMHLYQLRANKHHSVYLQRSYNKYGEDKFIFSIIEYDLSEEDLLIREQYYIDLLKPVYNSCPVAGTRKNSKHSPESIDKMRKAHLGHKVSDSYILLLKERFKGNTIASGNKNRRKVTPEIINQVEELRASGLGCRKIAAIVNLNKTTILNIFNKKYDYGRKC